MTNTIDLEKLRHDISVKELKRANFAKLLKMIFYVALAALGFLVFIFSIITFFLRENFYGIYTADQTYGGDAYTGMQNAMADASNNVSSVGYLLSSMSGCFATIAGLTLLSASWIIMLVAVYKLVKVLTAPVVVKQSRIDDLVATEFLKRSLKKTVAPAPAPTPAPVSAPASAPAPAPTPAPAVDPAVSNTIDELRKYKQLMDAGFITQEEYEFKKRQLLGI